MCDTFGGDRACLAILGRSSRFGPVAGIRSASRPGGRSVAHALGAITDDERVLVPLLRFADDPDAAVRLAVAQGIPTVIPLLPDEAVAALLQLMRDHDSRVRDWATMTLGQRDNDGKQIRDAFVERLTDTGGATAGEATVALARRGDPRVTPLLEQALLEDSVGNLYVEAAAELGDPRLLPLLERLRATGWEQDDPRDWLLDEAIAACRDGKLHS